jgi:L-ascorbate metabolism protein UlaG (beta-lactamase superfamily)
MLAGVNRTGGMMIARGLAILAWLIVAAVPAEAQMSRCLAVADAAPHLQPAAYTLAQLKPDEVRIRFAGHSTFVIESADGVTIATDYTGNPRDMVPHVVTMNRAHSSHYTDNPDPRIPHVLRGWNPEGGPADHHLQVGDVTIRNVPTDIRVWSGGRMPDGNSIFIFEVANLCIGHLGHLHHELGPEHVGWIGRLDVLMVPVDGSYTIAQASMIEVIKLLRARLVLPMHYFGPTTLRRFLDGLGEEFDIEISSTPEVVLSEATLPSAPKVLVLPGY